MKILFFGDIVGKIGRRGVISVLPEWIKQHQPDLIMANVENLAHGKGITRSTIAELQAAGITAFTGGNHIWDKPEVKNLIDEGLPLARPINYPSGTPGSGLLSLNVAGKNLLIINAMGMNYMPVQLANPFEMLEQLQTTSEWLKADIRLLDFHAEANGEKWAMGWMLDGKVHAVLGTHTHVPTADSDCLLAGTVYQSDIGMSGAWDSVIGAEKLGIINKLRQQQPTKHEYAETGLAIVNAVLLDLKPDFQQQSIVRLQAKIAT